MTPRGISRYEAAHYVGVTLATFSKWVASGTLPTPIPNTRRWDRKAIDLALDKASGIAHPAVVTEQAETDWERKYEARKASTGAGGRNQATS
jgi:hypothetical protein